MGTHPLANVVRYAYEATNAAAADARTDAELLECFAATREEHAFAALVARHRRLVMRVCRGVLRHDQDAEDAFQAVFLVLARKAGSLHKAGSLGSWLYGVAYRTARRAGTMAAKQRARENRRTERSAVNPVSEASLRELQALLDREVSRLPEKYRSPFVLCCLEGRSKSEAARELGWKEGTVSGRLAQARARLQTRLTRLGVTLSAGLAAVAVCPTSHAAAVSAAVSRRTLLAAVQFAGRAPVAAGLASPQAVALAHGLLQTLAVSRLAVVLGLVLVTGAGGVAGAAAAATALAGAANEKTSADIFTSPAFFSANDKSTANLVAQATPRNIEADRTRTQENLRQIGAAMLAYHKANQCLPAPAIYSQEGTPLLSWRVAILPYLGQKALYDSFKLDEPWDGPHNHALLARMPMVYAPPGVKIEMGATFYQVFKGKGTVFEDRTRINLRDITDGTSATIMAVEAGEPTPWTEPHDLPFDNDKPLPRLGGVIPGEVTFVAVDGFVHHAKAPDEGKLKSAIQRASDHRKDLRNLQP